MTFSTILRAEYRRIISTSLTAFSFVCSKADFLARTKPALPIVRWSQARKEVMDPSMLEATTFRKLRLWIRGKQHHRYALYSLETLESSAGSASATEAPNSVRERH